jgi:hypothetical protein
MIRNVSLEFVAERVGFEPTDQLPSRHLSKVVLSATQPSLLELKIFFMAEREGFEPPVDCSTTVFKTAAFDHSAISP